MNGSFFLWGIGGKVWDGGENLAGLDPIVNPERNSQGSVEGGVKNANPHSAAG